MIHLSLRVSTALLFGASLAGCAAIGSTTDEARAPGGMFNPGNYASSHGLVESSPMRRGARPVAALPASAGRVVDVREKRLGNGFMQEIVLAADSGVRGENLIVVYVRDQPNPPIGEQEIEFPKDREDDLAAEIDKRFPGGALRFTDTLLRNTYGPYGVALGRLGGANCVYFWQTLNDLKPYIRTARFSPYKIETATRVRLCRSGVDAQTLARWAAAITLDTAGVSEAPLAAASGPQGASFADPLADALDNRRGGVARGERFAGYATPAASSFAEDAAPRRAVRYAAPRRRHVVRYVRVRRAPARVEQDYAAQPAAPQTYAQPAYGQAAAAAPAYAAGYAQPGQVIWTQPGAAAIAQSAAPAYGGAPAAAGSVGLPPQAFSGPAAQGWVAAPR